MEPLYLSKSRLACFCTCPQKYKLTYIDKIVPEKTPTNMVEGSAIHHIVEQAIVYKAVPNMADVAAQEFWNKIELSSVAYESQEDFTAAQEKVLEVLPKNRTGVIATQSDEENTHVQAKKSCPGFQGPSGPGGSFRR